MAEPKTINLPRSEYRWLGDKARATIAKLPHWRRMLCALVGSGFFALGVHFLVFAFKASHGIWYLTSGMVLFAAYLLMASAIRGR